MAERTILVAGDVPEIRDLIRRMLEPVYTVNCVTNAEGMHLVQRGAICADLIVTNRPEYYLETGIPVLNISVGTPPDILRHCRGFLPKPLDRQLLLRLAAEILRTPNRTECLTAECLPPVVLVAAAEDMSFREITAALRAEGCDVIPANTRDDVMRCLQGSGQHCDLVLVDAELPNCDPTELIWACKRMAPKADIAAATSQYPDNFLIMYGADHIIRKPVSRGPLLRILRRMTHRKQLESSGRLCEST